MISGGGTGGHIFPALAIAQEYQRRHPQAPIRFVGARGRMEMKRIPQAGYPIHGLWISGLQRSLTIRNLLFPLKLLVSLWRSYRLLKRYKPSAVVGTGGYASGPLGFMASRMGIPTLLQEQNSFPGITNKLLASRAARICVAYPRMERFFPKAKIRLTGNPIRDALLRPLPETQSSREALGLDPERPSLLILGGSQGAKRINQLVEESIPYFRRKEINVLWQCGQLYYPELSQKQLALPPDQFVLRPFLDDMPQAFAAADLVVSRAGAGTLSELAVVGKPALLIPSPHVAEDHQTKNAQSLAAGGGAVLMRETETIDYFQNSIAKILFQQEEKEKMASQMRQRALPHATEEIVDELENLMPYAR